MTSTIKRIAAAAIFSTAALGLSFSANAADYVVDTSGAHASINFETSHLGFSFIAGRFNTFEGTFTFDESNPANSKVSITIDTASVDTNHAERDKHLRSGDFLNVSKHPEATFVSTSIKDLGGSKGEIAGDLTLNGVTKNITIDAEKIGEGEDPWGGYRAGFKGSTVISMKDFNMGAMVGAGDVELTLHIEGIRQ